MRSFSTGSIREPLKTFFAAAGLALATMVLAPLANAESYGPRLGVETRPIVYTGIQIASASPGAYYSATQITYYNSPVVVMAPVTQRPAMIVPVNRSSMLMAQANSTCTEGNWRRADGMIVYGIACHQPDGTWRLVQ